MSNTIARREKLQSAQKSLKIKKRRKTGWGGFPRSFYRLFLPFCRILPAIPDQIRHLPAGKPTVPASCLPAAMQKRGHISSVSVSCVGGLLSFDDSSPKNVTAKIKSLLPDRKGKLTDSGFLPMNCGKTGANEEKVKGER